LKYVYRFSHCFSNMSVAFSHLLFNKFEFGFEFEHMRFAKKDMSQGHELYLTAASRVSIYVKPG